MEVILIHKPLGPIPPEAAKKSIDDLKKILAAPSEVVPGGKMIAAYTTRAQWCLICIWDVPTIDALMPLLESMTPGGWNTDILPIEKTEAAIPKWEKALAEFKLPVFGKFTFFLRKTSHKSYLNL